ncbi:hypothetical protein T492DRAFT_508077, partial [Pavlovales sp. CCMP2436]
RFAAQRCTLGSLAATAASAAISRRAGAVRLPMLDLASASGLVSSMLGAEQAGGFISVNDDAVQAVLTVLIREVRDLHERGAQADRALAQAAELRREVKALRTRTADAEEALAALAGSVRHLSAAGVAEGSAHAGSWQLEALGEAQGQLIDGLRVLRQRDKTAQATADEALGVAHEARELALAAAARTEVAERQPSTAHTDELRLQGLVQAATSAAERAEASVHRARAEMHHRLAAAASELGASWEMHHAQVLAESRQEMQTVATEAARRELAAQLLAQQQLVATARASSQDHARAEARAEASAELRGARDAADAAASAAVSARAASSRLQSEWRAEARAAEARHDELAAELRAELGSVVSRTRATLRAEAAAAAAEPLPAQPRAPPQELVEGRPVGETVRAHTSALASIREHLGRHEEMQTAVARGLQELRRELQRERVAMESALGVGGQLGAADNSIAAADAAAESALEAATARASARDALARADAAVLGVRQLEALVRERLGEQAAHVSELDTTVERAAEDTRSIAQQQARLAHDMARVGAGLAEVRKLVAVDVATLATRLDGKADSDLLGGKADGVEVKRLHVSLHRLLGELSADPARLYAHRRFYSSRPHLLNDYRVAPTPGGGLLWPEGSRPDGKAAPSAKPRARRSNSAGPIRPPNSALA